MENANPNSNRPILSRKPKIAIPVVIEVIPVIELPTIAKVRKVTNGVIIRKLVKLFPLAFFGIKESKLPLAYGILKQVFESETGISRIRIRKAIKSYTSRIAYHTGVIDSENRINLDGSIASNVTSADKDYSASRIIFVEEIKLAKDNLAIEQELK